ncbi:MAG TPA: GIY-YIG nuclease family protein [Bryobacteraceae bacterium]|jgi:hypothetical protein|nr:GIY-YIG nuclease family protein [Bryobacteraceae bacterium]
MTGGLEEFQTRATIRRHKKPPLVIRQVTQWNQRFGVVYFLRESSIGLIKIGFTSGDPQKRLVNVANALKATVKWVGYFRAQAVEEIAAHQRFRHLHVRNEWFRPEAELLKWMEEMSPIFDEASALDELFDLALIARVKAITARQHQGRIDFHGLMRNVDYLDFIFWLCRRRIPSAELLNEVRATLRKLDSQERAAA